MKIFGKLLKAAAKLFSIVLMAVILLQLAGSVFGEHELPALFGYSCLSVLSGSMEPAVSAGDLIVIHRQTDYKNGDIITLHRMPEVIVQKEMPIIYRMRLRYGRNRWRER